MREFEARWWASARKGEVKELTDMLAGGREVLATTVDDNGRTCVPTPRTHGRADPLTADASRRAARCTLRAASARRSACSSCSTTALTSARGCVLPAVPRHDAASPPVSPAVQDKEGYTPLHIAAGYLNRGVVRLLLAAGADPELQDKQGRSALDLIVALKENTPNTAEFFTRRGALDEVAKACALLRSCMLLLILVLTCCRCLAQELEKQLFEELEPRAILDKRGGGEGEDAAPLEYLVHWGDGSENTWEVRQHVCCST